MLDDKYIDIAHPKVYRHREP